VPPSSSTTYTANFTTQYYLTTASGAGGTVSPTSGWYNSGTSVQVSATANAGYSFSGFSGALSGTTTPQNVAMSAPASVTATWAPPFTLTITPPLSIAPGGTASFTITAYSSTNNQPIALNWLNPNNSLIGFGCQGFSLTQVGTYLPSTVTPGQAGVIATISMPVNGSMYNLQSSPIFVCDFEVVGSYGGFNSTEQGQLSVTSAPYYSFQQPAAQTSAAPGSATFPLNVSSANGFAGTVNFSATVSPNPCGITVSPVTSVALTSGGSGSTSLFLAVPTACAAQNYTVAISSSSTSSPGNSPLQTAILTVQQGADFTLSISPSPQPVIPGQSTTFNVAVIGTPAFNSAVNLNLGALTAGLSASLSSTTVQPGGSVTLNVATSTSTPTLTLPILITGSGGALSHAASAVMSMTTAGSTITLPPLSLVRGGLQGLAYVNPALGSDTVQSCPLLPLNVGLAILGGANPAIGLTAASTASVVKTSISCATVGGKTIIVPLAGVYKIA
jgi:hypothetical protein